MSKKRLILYGKCVVIGIILFVFCAFTQGLFQAENAGEVFGKLSDCFVVPGVLLFGIGGLSWVAYQGAFDMIGYSGSLFFSHFIRSIKTEKTFYDYKVRKEETRKGWRVHMLITGFGFLAAGAICMVLYLLL